MDKKQKLELIQRSLGLRHKLKVHDSMKQPETHEDMAMMFLSRWDHEDELQAIEDILGEQRRKNIAEKRANLLKNGVPKTSETDSDGTKKKKK